MALAVRKDSVPSAQRIAEILRSAPGPWPSEAQVNPVDLAQHVVSQSRRMLEMAGGPGAPAAAYGPTGAAAATIAFPSAADQRVSQLGERVSVLVAGLQQRIDAEKHDTAGQLKQVSVQVEERMRIFEARVAACEERTSAQEHQVSDAQAMASTMAAREARASVSNSLSEVQAQWQAHLSDIRCVQQEHSRKLDELGEDIHHITSRMEWAEGALGDCEKALRRSEDEFQDLVVRSGQRPPWFGQLESTTARLEQRLSEQQAATEAQLGRLRVDTDGLLRRCDGLRGLRDELLREAADCMQQELDRLNLHHSGHVQMQASNEAPAVRELSRRMEDSEARIAALKVRIDGHDSRLASIGERSESLCHQALEGTRQACKQHREEILSEAECQLSILRQRVESIGDLCEELTMKQAPFSQRGALYGQHDVSYGQRSDAVLRNW